MTTDNTHALVAQMRESLSGAVEWLESEGLDLGGVGEGFNQVIAAADQWLDAPPTNQCGETCERAKLCATCARGLEQETDRAQRMRDAGYTRRPTLREIASLEPLTDAQFIAAWHSQTGRMAGTDRALLLLSRDVTERAHGIKGAKE